MNSDLAMVVEAVCSGVAVTVPSAGEFREQHGAEVAALVQRGEGAGHHRASCEAV